MNMARWIVADQMLREKERRFIRRIARLLGTDLALTGRDEFPTEEKFGDPPQVFPLAGLINPEAYQKFMETDSSQIEGSSIPDEEYEKQAAILESAGALTDIDVLSDEAERIFKEKKKEEGLESVLSNE